MQHPRTEMEGFIEEDDVPNGATHGEGLFSGILVFSTISLSIPGPFTTITTKLFFRVFWSPNYWLEVNHS